MARTAIPLMVRTSERLTFANCRQQWAWGYEERLRSKASVAPALRFGDLVHQALAAYYRPGRKRGPRPSRTFKRLYDIETEKASRYGIRDLDGEWHEAGELGVIVLDHYLDTYGSDSAIEIIEPEHPFFWPMRDAGGSPFIYVGRFDAVFRWITTGEVGLLEHKTAAALGRKNLAMDEQAGSYWAFALRHLLQIGVIKQGQDLDMILYNFLRKAKPDERPTNEEGLYLNQDGSVSKKQPPPYFDRVPVYRDAPDRHQVIRRIKLQAWEMRMVREGKLAVYKRPTDDCSSCSYLTMCELHETGSDWEEYKRQAFVEADPYEDYRADFKKWEGK
jgi:hypothetical protein